MPRWLRITLPRVPLHLRLVGLALVCLFLLPACPSQPPSSSSPYDTVTLQLKWKHQFQFAGYYAAVEKGFYREAGLEVKLREAPPDIEPAQAVLQGKADFGIAASDLVLFRGRGNPVVALAAIYQHSPLVLLATKQQNLGSVHDLAGKRVMIEPHAAELLAYLEAESVPTSKMTLVPHSFDPNALITGQVDALSAYSTDEPYLLQQAGLNYLTFNPRASGIDFYGDTLFTTETQIREHPRRVQAFLDASLRGWEYAMANPDELATLIYTRYSRRHSLEHLAFEAEQTARLILPDVVEIGYMNPGRWQRIAEIYAEQGMLSPALSLQGFLYDRAPKPDLTWLYLSLIGTIGLVGLVSLVAARFFRLNAHLRREMAKRARAEAHERVLEARYRTLAENGPFPIIISRSADSTILYVNAETAQKFEITQEFALGKGTRDFYANPKDQDRLMAILNRQGFVKNHETKLVTATGQHFWANLSATVITFDEQTAIFFAVLDITERKNLELRLKNMAMTDELTGLYNRRYFTLRGGEEFTRTRRYRQPFSVLMLDADNFKQINDTYSHEGGDEVLRRLATVLKRNLREIDIAGRLGGEEFGIILPNTPPDHALCLAERLRQTVEHLVIETRGRSICLTVSIGVATFTENMLTLDDLLRHADAALYKAKHSGRNRVVTMVEGSCRHE